MDKDLQSKIISGQASAKEKESYFQLLSNDKEEARLFFEAKNLWVKLGVNDPADQTTTDRDFESFWARIQASKRINLRRSTFETLKYAASIILLIGFGAALSYFIAYQKVDTIDFQANKLVAESGSIAHFEFVDGTTIWLNSGSEIILSNDNGKSRVIELTGEAFFNVKNADEIPFIVLAGDLKIKDLGTSFNVKAYPADEEIKTTLIDGSVELLQKNNQFIARLNPGEQAHYLKNEKTMAISKVDIDLVSAWIDGKFAFRDQRLEDICHELENWYDVKFVFGNEQIKDFRYSGSINRSTSINYVLKMIKVTTDLQYKINDKTYEPDEITVY